MLIVTLSYSKFESIQLQREEQGRMQGGGGVKTPPLELDILQNFITCAKEINCFRILFAC